MTRADKPQPDFDALRKERDEALRKLVDAVCEKHGWNRSEVTYSASPSGCYCACPDGPCEHEFGGWREFEDGSGGEQFCPKCGTGSMSHSMRMCW